jgi:hypothetical protein
MPTKTLVASAYAAHVARRGAEYGIVLDGAVRVDGGARSRLTLGPVGVTSMFSAGDRIRVQRVTVPAGARSVEPYSFAGADRRGTLLWLAVAFAVLVIVRHHGNIRRWVRRVA